MIVKNEAQQLPRCLASVQGVVDELIVVDTGSTDQTVAVAQAAGARVFHHAWQDDFALARNASLEPATGDWILVLDADEVLEPGSQARLRATVAAAEADGLFVCQRNFLSPRALAAYSDVLYVRLFRRRPGLGYELALHEQILPSIQRQNGRLAASDLMIWHYGYVQPTVQGQENRLQRNIRVLEGELVRQPDNVFLCASLGLVYYQARQAVPAAQYLQRALTLGVADLPAEMLAEVYFVQAQLAHQAGRSLQALEYAEASIACGGAGGVNALNFVAQTQLQAGEQAVQAAQALPAAAPAQPATVADSVAQLQAGRAYLRQAQVAFERAAGALGRLQSHPQLNPAARGEVTAALERCRAVIRSTSTYLEQA